MKRLVGILLILVFLSSCKSDDPKLPDQCFDGLEIIRNNPNAEVFTNEEGFLVVRIPDPQAIDDVILRYTIDGFVQDRNYYLDTSPSISDFESDEGADTPPTAYIINTEIAYDFDITDPIISIKAGGDVSNVAFPGFNRGAPNLSRSSNVPLRIIIEGAEADVIAGAYATPVTWAGFLPDPLVTSISLGVSPQLERNFDTQLLEFRFRLIDVENPFRRFKEERTMRFNFDCD